MKQGIISLAKAGRKRNDRSSTGRQNVRKVGLDMLMAMQPHRRCLPEAERLSPKAITTLGQLNLQRRIKDIHLQAGELYREVVNKYRAVIGSIDPLMAPQWGSGNLSDEEAERRWAAYEDAYCALSRAGRKWAPTGANQIQFAQECVKWVNRVAIYDESCPISAFPALVCGLQALAEHFQLDGRKQRWHSRK